MRDLTSAEVIADSVSPDGVRLTTLRLCFPRFILAEVNTHRMLSRNSASSRAIPTEDLIDRVRTAPFVPTVFNHRVKGMGVGDELDQRRTKQARSAWISAAMHAADHAEMLMDIGLDKSRANRLLEPFLWNEAIVTATEWNNMLALRDHASAQPEFRTLAKLMKKAFVDSIPQPLDYGHWHLPLVTEDELSNLCGLRRVAASGTGPLDTDDDLVWEVDRLKRISASRCARVSYGRTDDESVSKTLERAKMLMGNGHLSPLEHVARPVDEGGRAGNPDWVTITGFVGNLRGWVSFRKEIPHEDRFDLGEAARENAMEGAR